MWDNKKTHKKKPITGSELTAEHLRTTILEVLQKKLQLIQFHSTLIRKTIATILLILAIGAYFFNPKPLLIKVAVAATDLSPGKILNSTDIRFKEIPKKFLPHNALTKTENIVNHYLTTGMQQEEFFTSTRLADYYQSNQIDQTRSIIPIKLIDPKLTQFLHPGQKITLLKLNSTTSRNDKNLFKPSIFTEIICKNAIVIMVTQDSDLMLVSVPIENVNEISMANLENQLNIAFN